MGSREGEDGVAGDRLARHNLEQRHYFESRTSPRMVPRPSPYVARQVREMIRFASLAPGQRVLDVGCGMGRYTLPLADAGIAVEGLDVSPVLLDRLREYGAGVYDIPLHCCDIWRPPEELLGRYDAVVGFFTLHHLHDLELSFASMAKLARPGGDIAFLEPNALNPAFYVQIMVTPGMSWDGDGGMVRMRRGPVHAAMADAGLVDLRLERFGFFPPMVSNRRWGGALERVLERNPLWRPLLPFQLFGGHRS
jgi:SAM-dependent methyltransferase